MLTIRDEQIHLLGERRREAFLVEMCAHLRRHFAVELEHLSAAQLRAEVIAAARDAEEFGLETRRDLCRYLSLCAVFGWDFPQREEHAWMQAALTDPRVSQPSERLRLLAAECLYREETLAQQRQARAGFRGGEE